jgi:surfeit locus 1 family protein
VSLRALAPAPLFTVAVLLVIALFVRLGFWQWQRGAEREAQWQRFAQGSDTVVALGERDPDGLPLYQRVAVSGRLDGAHQFLLDNLSQRGRPGYQVLTPLERSGGGLLLIDRGFVPFSGSRARLPEIALPAAAAPQSLSGRLAQLPSAGLPSGRAAPDPAAPWPKLTSFPRPADLSAALGRQVPARILLLDPGAPHGYLREWQPPGLTPLRHYSYAIQWWVFAAAALVGWVVLSARRGRSR